MIIQRTGEGEEGDIFPLVLPQAGYELMSLLLLTAHLVQSVESEGAHNYR